MQTELNKVVTALQEFYARETFLLDRDVGERALTHRLAVEFEKHFPGWEIDCEFDRLGDRTLRLPHGSTVSTDDHLAKSIYPDIVVHQRAIPNNLLAVEVRKSANHQPLEHDRHKLRALTDPHVWFAYWIGVLLTLGKTHVTMSEVYTSGVLDQALSGWFAQRLKDAGLSAG
ncbi:hypothetical protein [Bradyrhizobium icense]|uniref:Restriction endonuclease n=1 Tax=Bradyrhizobium icense TaxID=1274631 RepID=A0A1B1UAF1_9BRAD|nr:hypothetical protein [Bradyrhizobium icense]ANV99744.1 hypothetical protein LMTR13_05690 [Bradyrhizobium icense]